MEKVGQGYYYRRKRILGYLLLMRPVDLVALFYRHEQHDERLQCQRERQCQQQQRDEHR